MTVTWAHLYILTPLTGWKAKGYPDILSRSFLHLLSTSSFRNGYRIPPVYAFVDFDPDGLAIYSTYKHGSVSLAHENESLNVPAMQWLGIKSIDMSSSSSMDNIHGEQGLLRLTARDRSKAHRLIEKRIDTRYDVDAELIGELQVMLMLNVKAEIQLLEAKPGGLSQWLASQASLNGDRFSSSHICI